MNYLKVETKAVIRDDLAWLGKVVSTVEVADHILVEVAHKMTPGNHWHIYKMNGVRANSEHYPSLNIALLALVLVRSGKKNTDSLYYMARVADLKEEL